MTEPTPSAPPRVVVDTSTALPVLTLKGPPDHWLAKLWKSKLIIPLATNETMAELQEQVIRHSPVTGDNQVRLFVNRTMRRTRPYASSSRGRTSPTRLNAGIPRTRCSST